MALFDYTIPKMATGGPVKKGQYKDPDGYDMTYDYIGGKWIGYDNAGSLYDMDEASSQVLHKTYPEVRGMEKIQPLPISNSIIPQTVGTIDKTIPPRPIIPKVETPLSTTLFDSYMKSNKEQQAYNIGKTVSDSILTAGSLIGNLTAKRPEPIMPKPTVPATYQSAVPEEKNLADRSQAASLAAGRKVAQETGRPELMPAYLADINASQNTAYGALADKEIEQRNLQSVADAAALNKTNENEYTGRIADATMMDAVNLKRSELEAAMKKSLFNTIPNTYMNNQSSLVDMGNKAAVYKYIIDKSANDPKYLALLNSFKPNSGLYAGAYSSAIENPYKAPTTTPTKTGSDADGNKYYSDGSKWYSDEAMTTEVTDDSIITED